MVSSNDAGASFLAGVVFGCISGIALCAFVTSISWKKSAIENNCGHYNSLSGAFEWGPSPIAEKKDDGNL